MYLYLYLCTHSYSPSSQYYILAANTDGKNGACSFFLFMDDAIKMLPVEIINMYGLSIWNGSNREKMPSRRRRRRSSSRGVSVRECYFGNFFSVLVEFFPSSLYSRFDVSRRVLAPFPMEMEMNINAKTARTHLCLDTHTHSLTHSPTPLCTRCVQTLHIYFFRRSHSTLAPSSLSLCYLYAPLWGEPVPYPLSHTRFHIAIFLIFTLSSIIKFYGFLCEQKENRVP